MKILLINNYQQGNETETYEALKTVLAGHDVEYRRYQPGITFNDGRKDLVILSGGGGEGSEINDRYSRDKLWYQDQINYILGAKKPILGICMGFEVIARAYGAQVVQMKDYVTGFRKLTTTQSGQSATNRQVLSQYENHIWRVPSVPAELEILAESSTGIEMIRHHSRPIFATQFHPERGGTLKLSQLLSV